MENEYMDSFTVEMVDGSKKVFPIADTEAREQLNGLSEVVQEVDERVDEVERKIVEVDASMIKYGSGSVADEIVAINNRVNGKQPLIEQGVFLCSCNVGENHINASNITSGTFPSRGALSCIAMIINHSLYQNSKDILSADASDFIINAESAQTLTVRWIAL